MGHRMVEKDPQLFSVVSCLRCSLVLTFLYPGFQVKVRLSCLLIFSERSSWMSLTCVDCDYAFKHPILGLNRKLDSTTIHGSQEQRVHSLSSNGNDL